MIKEILQKKFKVLNIYEYGSRVYGYKKSQDLDFIVVVEDPLEKPQQFNISGRDVTVYSKDFFQEQVKRHEISCLECLWLSSEMVIQENFKFDFNLDKDSLRKSCSQKSSNSWVKAKKKLTVKESISPYIGKKSLFHSLRILDFAIQIAEKGKIVNYQESNHYWKDIDSIDNWDDLKKKYQTEYNRKKSKLRELCPKK